MPHDLTMTLTGAGILWFGWFGFNAGSALTSGPLAALAFVTTHLGAAGGAAGWLPWRVVTGKPTALGAASGLVAGLVAITPAAGYVAPWAAIVIGLTAGVVCYGGVLLKDRFGYDDTLDAFGVHGVGGILGALLTGVLAQKVIDDAGANGLAFGGTRLFGVQCVAVGLVAVYSAGLTWVILKVVDALVGLRVGASEEGEGLDVGEHGEQAYHDGGMAIQRTREAPAEPRLDAVLEGVEPGRRADSSLDTLTSA